MADDKKQLMKLPANFNELISQAQEQRLYTNLVKQLNKDLVLANIDLEFDEDVLPSSLKLILNETIYHLLQDKFMDYLNLLYIVDVPEEQLKQFDGCDILEMSQNITFIILLREWQKVWYKHTYS